MKTTITVFPSVLFGRCEVPQVLLEAGFTVFTHAEDFAKARRSGQDYIIQVAANGEYHLWLCLYDGEKTKLNPHGEFLETAGGPHVICKSNRASAQQPAQ